MTPSALRGVRSRADVEGRLVFITGGASGIGLGMARAFAAQGAHIALADVRQDAAEYAARELAGRGARTIGVPLDVRDSADWHAALDRAESALGPLAILCSNAGVAGSRLNLEDTSAAAMDWTFDVNVGGAFNAIRTCVPRLRQYARPGHIVFTASLGALLVRPGNGVYSASKAAVIAFAEALRSELEETALGVSVLYPGLVSTHLLEGNTALAPHGVALGTHEPELEAAMRAALDADAVGKMVVHGVYEGRFWLATHPELNAALEARFAEIVSS